MAELIRGIRRDLAQDGVLAALCVVGVALAAVALLKPASGRGDTTVGHAIATVTSVISAVRLRPATTLVWNRVAPEDTAFESDVVFVPADGTAALRFTDGTELRLDPNTLIVLEPSATNARPRVGLREGSVVGESGDLGLEIQSASGEKVVVAKSSRVHVVRDKKGTRVQVLEGQAQVATAAGESNTVGAREVGGFDHAGALRANERPAVNLVDPPPQGNVDVSKSKSVRLRWQADDEQAYSLQVARDPEFTTKLLDRQMAAGTSEHEIEIGPGIYWWRLVDDRGAVRSAVFSFHAIAASPPVLIFPRMNQVVLAPPDRGLVFTWSFVEGCSAYVIEVARDDRFSTVALSEEVEGPQLWIGGGLDEGYYYWRVRADDCGNAPFSSAGHFRLISKPLLDAPTTMDAEVVDK